MNSTDEEKIADYPGYIANLDQVLDDVETGLRMLLAALQRRRYQALD